MARQRRRLSYKEINRIAKNAKASLAIEGLKPTSFSTMLGKQVLRGEISEQQAIQAVIKKYLPQT